MGPLQSTHVSAQNLILGHNFYSDSNLLCRTTWSIPQDDPQRILNFSQVSDKEFLVQLASVQTQNWEWWGAILDHETLEFLCPTSHTTLSQYKTLWVTRNWIKSNEYFGRDSDTLPPGVISADRDGMLIQDGTIAREKQRINSLIILFRYVICRNISKI